MLGCDSSCNNLISRKAVLLIPKKKRLSWVPNKKGGGGSGSLIKNGDGKGCGGGE